MIGAFRALLGPGSVAVFVGMASVAGAQSPRPVAVGIAVGSTIPIGDYGSDTKAGVHGAAYVQYEPAKGVWGIRGEVAYHRSDLTDEALGDVGAGPDDKVTSAITHVGATALLVGNKRDKTVTPYLLGGLGLYRLTVSASDGSLSRSSSENGFGFNGGLGVRVGRNAGLFMEARFHQFSITPEGSAKTTYQMIPVTVGVRF